MAEYMGFLDWAEDAPPLPESYRDADTWDSRAREWIAGMPPIDPSNLPNDLGPALAQLDWYWKSLNEIASLEVDGLGIAIGGLLTAAVAAVALGPAAWIPAGMYAVGAAAYTALINRRHKRFESIVSEMRKRVSAIELTLRKLQG